MRVEEIERYLSKQMPPEERDHFMKEMECSPSLRFDVQLVAAVIRKTRELYLRRDQDLVARMCESRKSDKKRFRVTIAAMFVATVAAVASLLFVGYKVMRKDNSGAGQSTTAYQDKTAPYDIQTGIADAAGGKGDKMFPIEVNIPATDTKWVFFLNLPALILMSFEGLLMIRSITSALFDQQTSLTTHRIPSMRNS